MTVDPKYKLSHQLNFNIFSPIDTIGEMLEIFEIHNGTNMKTTYTPHNEFDASNDSVVRGATTAGNWQYLWNAIQ